MQEEKNRRSTAKIDPLSQNQQSHIVIRYSRPPRLGTRSVEHQRCPRPPFSRCSSYHHQSHPRLRSATCLCVPSCPPAPASPALPRAPRPAAPLPSSTAFPHCSKKPCCPFLGCAEPIGLGGRIGQFVREGNMTGAGGR